MIVKSVNELTEKDYFKLAEYLKNDGIIVYPTETIYGIGGNALKENVIKKIFEIKNRKPDKNFIWLFKDLSMMEKYLIINDIEKKIIKKYLPGALTIILKSKIEKYQTIAARISPHPFIKKIFQYINFPLISTSANISGKNYDNDFNVILKYFQNKIKIFIKDDSLLKVKNPLPSTIIKVENNKIKIIRQGKVRLTDLA